MVLQHEWLRLPILVSVKRSPEGQLSYFNQFGTEIVLQPLSYDARLELTEQDRQIMQRTMEKIRSHKAWSPWGSDKAPRHVLAKSVVGAGILGSAPVMSELLIVDAMSSVTTFSAAMAAGIAGLAFTGRMFWKDCLREMSEINQAVEEWNEDTQETFSGLFTSLSQQALFTDALMSLCASRGIVYEGQLRVSKALRRSTTQSWDYARPADSSETSRGDSSQIGPSITFQGSGPGSARSAGGPFRFDGQHFYRYYPDRHSLCPVA